VRGKFISSERGISVRRLGIMMAVAVGVALLVVPSALAQGTGPAGYPISGVSNNAEGQLAEEVTSGALPFTGLNLVLIVAGGILLLGLGTMLLLKGRGGRTEVR
jgi:hypothetical protein